MPNRVPLATLENLTARIAKNARILGLLAPGDGLDLQIGSKTNGVAYRLHKIQAGESGRSTFAHLDSMGFLGWTSTEAETSLSIIDNVLWSVVEIQKGS